MPARTRKTALAVVPDPTPPETVTVDVSVMQEMARDLALAEVRAKAATDWAREQTHWMDWHHNRSVEDDTWRRKAGESLTDALTQAVQEHQRTSKTG